MLLISLQICLLTLLQTCYKLQYNTLLHMNLVSSLLVTEGLEKIHKCMLVNTQTELDCKYNIN